MSQRMRIKPSNPHNSITIRKVAAEAGVSTATVSRSVAGLNGLKEHVRDRVSRAVTKLDYQPNHLARGLRLGHLTGSHLITPQSSPNRTGAELKVETTS